MALQTLVSRELDPGTPGVLTIGKVMLSPPPQTQTQTIGTFNAGTAPNIIPQSATLEGTVRTQVGRDPRIKT